MRTKSSILNMITAYIGQISSVLIALISRFFFVKILGSSYLGINGLFSNILMFLSLVELGVGPAIIYSLYKPIADKNHEEIKSLMRLYRRVYIIIGFVVFILGTSLTPFLSFFIKDMPDIPHMQLIYILFVIYSSVSYFLCYKKSLINCGSKRYILPIYKYVIFFIVNVFQIVLLILTHNYILYLIIQILGLLIENILVSLKANKMYPYLKERNIQELDINTKNNIIKNTKAMVGHKLGEVVVRSTDSILISKIVNLAAVGIYSNYFLVTNALDSIANQLFNSITSSAGNLYATSDVNESHRVFKSVLFVNFVIYNIFCTLLMVIFNPFIELWLGRDMLFNINVVIVIILNFYLSGMRKSVLVFRDAMGLYYEDRLKPIFESIINLVFSILLAYKYGVIGVLIGTTISTVTTCLWIEPYVLYKYGFKSSVGIYYKKYFTYSIITLISVLISYYLCSMINIIGLIGILIKLFVSLLTSIIIIILLFRKQYEYKYILNILKNIKIIVKG